MGHPMTMRGLCSLALTSGSLALLVPAETQAQASAQPQAVSLAPAVRLAAYRERVERLEDQAAIENLTATFGYYFDKGLWDQAASLFSRSGAFEYEQQGVYIGRDRIRRAMLLFGPQGLAPGYLNNHMMLQNVIVVAPDGRTATGRWQGPMQLAKPGANGQHAVGIYENQYVKEGGVWKFAKLHFYLTAKTDYDKPWTNGAVPMEGASALFPPDRPPSEVYRSFPAAYIPPFSFDHPVTGKPLKDLPLAGDEITGRAPIEFGE
jgi:hypothetical protein